MLCLLLSSPSLAFAPTPLQGVEPVRLRTTTAEGQATFRQTRLWREFVEGEGRGWQARVDERTGTPHRMWGGLPLVSRDADALEVEAALRAFTARHTELLGAPADLPMRALESVDDAWYADFQAMRDGVPIWRSALTFRIRAGSLALVGADTYPTTPTRGAWVLDEDVAVQRAVAGGPAPTAPHTDREVSATWLPRVEHGLLVLRAVYEVRTHTREPVGHWVTFVDAESGEVVAWYNDVRFLTGTVSATHDDRFPGNGTVTSPVKGARVTNGNAAVTTDAAGGFNVPNGASYQTHFLSSPINLADSQGNVGLNFDASNPNPVWNATNGSIAAIDTFVFLNEVRDTFAAVVPTLPYTTAALDGTVNIDDACNAYYDGTVNFFRSGQGCQNTGRIADVVYHEWGHGLHFELIVTGTFDGALSEGAGDTTSFLMTGDSELAPGVLHERGALRSADNDRTFPTDIVNEVHEDGLIYAGAMWDTYTGLIGGYGGPAATDITSDLFTSMLRGGPDIESSIDEALFADDDDGDLSNGTPHACYIVPAFAGHGLGQLGSTTTSFSVGHVPDAFHDPSRPVGIDLEVVGPPGCGADLAAGTGTLSWRANGGVWSDVPLTVTGTLASGSIPAQPPGTFVEYHAVVEGAGQTLEAPTNGWRNPFSFYVGSVLEVRCDDFEGDDGGFTHALLAGENTDGADDWQHGAPNGQSGDPVTAHSGSFVWGNDLGYDGYNGAYQANRNNRLTGPVVELGHYEGAFLQYWRWLTVEDAAYDQASILANDTVVWTNVVGAGEDHHLDRQWAPHVVDLGDPRGSVQVAFDLVSDGGVELGGWTVDDVCVYVPATANNRLGVTDFQAGEGGTGTVALTWTNPVHGPLAEVRVVRGKDGDCPTGPDDGDVVFFATAVELGAPMVAQDAVPSTDTYCYAVFPGDGSAFLGWAVEGWNVDTGSAEVAATPEQIEEQAEENGLDAFEAQYGSISGCGCRAGGPAGWLALLAVLPALRRRQVSR